MRTVQWQPALHSILSRYHGIEVISSRTESRNHCERVSLFQTPITIWLDEMTAIAKQVMSSREETELGRSIKRISNVQHQIAIKKIVIPIDMNTFQ